MDVPASGTAEDPEYHRTVPVSQPAGEVSFLFQPVDPDGPGPGRGPPLSGRPGNPRPHEKPSGGTGHPRPPRPGDRTAEEGSSGMPDSHGGEGRRTTPGAARGS